MIRVYLDWNVLSRLETNEITYKKLTSILSDENRCLIPYSDAHIHDIHRSYLKVGMDGIKGHLEKINQYSKSLFIVYSIKDVLEFQNLEAQEAMRQYIEAYENHDDLNFDLNEIMKPLESSFFPLVPIFKALLNVQVPNPLAIPNDGENANAHKEILDKSPRTSKDVQKILGDGETTSFGQIMENLLKMSSTIMTDDSYSEMRDAYQKDLKVNTGRLNSKKFAPIETLDLNAQKLQKENFMQLYESLLTEIDKKSLYNRIMALCRQVDFNGFYPENIKNGHHLDNIETDYKHIAYASTCDFFIVEDKTARAKATLVFELLGINVNVVTPKEFVDSMEKPDFIPVNGREFIDYLFGLPTTKPTVQNDGFNYYYLFSVLLDYFNLVSHPLSNEKHLLLQKFDSPNRVGIFIKEMELVRDILIAYFGKPILENNQLGDEFYGISWLTEDLVLLKLEYANQNFKLEVIQCSKMKGYKKLWHMSKSKFIKICKQLR